MTNGKGIHFDVARGAALRDAAVVAFLALVLGAFVAQVWAVPGPAVRAPKVAAVTQEAAAKVRGADSGPMGRSLSVY